MDVIKDYKNYNPPEAESPWIKFLEGTTTIRILSHSINWKSHYIRSEKKSHTCTGDISTCEWCQKGDQPKGRWAYLILNRSNKEIRVMEIGWSIFGTILQCAKDSDYGDPRKYDLKITRKGTGLETEYQVIPGKETKFTEEEEKVLKTSGLDDIDKATQKLVSYYEKDEVPHPAEEE